MAHWQTALSTLLVGACAAHTLWILLPVPLRSRWAARVRGNGTAGHGVPARSGGCAGCSGCNNAAAGPTALPRQAVVQIVRRPRVQTAVPAAPTSGR
jgi:hypothetical protein